MIGSGISYTNAKTYNNKKIACKVCGMTFNSIDNALECNHQKEWKGTYPVKVDEDGNMTTELISNPLAKE